MSKNRLICQYMVYILSITNKTKKRYELMAAIIEKLKQKFAPDKRYANFGSILLGLDIKGIKGTNCNISFDFPVTAIAGYNGAGKSTIAQIALCMYRAEKNSDNPRKYLKDFFVKTLLDKAPYEKSALIEARYAKEKDVNSTMQLSLIEDKEEDNYVKRQKVHYREQRWEGYRNQPTKNVYYYGMSYFIPYQEQHSNLLRDNNANITKSIDFDEEIVRRVADILSIEYTSLQNNNISNEKRSERVISANKRKASYSENHMGCGEGRLLKLVHALETAPKKSLFVIEEPETALHQEAQYKLSKYFLDVCYRKGHQIIFTTHSAELQRALPSEARKFIIRREENNTSIIDSPSIAQIQNYLSGGHIKKLIIVTEDELAKLYIEEILKEYSFDIFQNCAFFAMNSSYTELKNYVKQSQGYGIKIYGIVDENRRAEVENGITAFPENTAPEISIVSDEKTSTDIKQEFGIRAIPDIENHHNYFREIANITKDTVSYVETRCIKIHVKNKNKEYYSQIINQIEKWLSECDT